MSPARARWNTVTNSLLLFTNHTSSPTTMSCKWLSSRLWHEQDLKQTQYSEKNVSFETLRLPSERASSSMHTLAFDVFFLSLFLVIIPYLTSMAGEIENATNTTKKEDICLGLIEAYKNISSCCILLHLIPSCNKYNYPLNNLQMYHAIYSPNTRCLD